MGKRRMRARLVCEAITRRFARCFCIAPCIALFVIMLCGVALAETNDNGGNLLVDTYGQLIVVRPDGSQWSLAEGVNCAALSPDGKRAAFTTTAQNLVVMPLEGGAARELVKLPAGAHFEEIGWAPNGSAIAYEAAGGGMGDTLFLLSLNPDSMAQRNLGHWYQGFSFSPDGTRIVHAVNGPLEPGLEILDVATETRTKVHTTKNVVWDARFSPDGRFIAYRMTIRNPEGPEDEPDCTPPTLGLQLYSIADGVETPVTIRDAPEDWDDVKTYSWSADGTRIALTLGTTDCDYPGSAAGVFITSVDLKSQARLSTTDMAFEPVFSPNGDAVAFVDFSESPARLFRYDLATGALTLIRRATEEDNYYRLVDWR